ncbi:unnamed protein product [Dicrocoelium dendriticum]|nr:unnamed protein product [Dicrocoelium dendriticum]
MGAYITYQLIFKLSNRYRSSGVVIPPAPDKHVLDSTKMKISKDSLVETEFIERRRMSLERFMFRLLTHPVLQGDSDLREFLVLDGELPRFSGAQLLSGSSARKMLKSFGDSLGKITFRVDDPEEYFDQKSEELDTWERQMKRFHSSLSSLVASCQGLAVSRFAVSHTISQLANIEEHTGLAQALGSLANTEEEMSQHYSALAEAKLTTLADCARDSLGLIQASKEAVAERLKLFRDWKATCALIEAKQEQKLRSELSGRNEPKRIMALDAELEELRNRSEIEEENFTKVSKVVKEELERVDAARLADFVQAATQFLSTFLQTQGKILEAWESYLNRAKSVN